MSFPMAVVCGGQEERVLCKGEAPEMGRFRVCRGRGARSKLALTGMNIANEWVRAFPRGREWCKVELWERRCGCLPEQEHGGDGEIQARGNPHLPRSSRGSIETCTNLCTSLEPSGLSGGYR
jgi:hypothetical protein